MIFVDAQAPSFMHRFAQTIENWVLSQLSQPMRLPVYTVATLPDASRYRACLIYVSDETGGAVPCFSTGSAWLRVTDRAVAS